METLTFERRDDHIAVISTAGVRIGYLRKGYGGIWNFHSRLGSSIGLPAPVVREISDKLYSINNEEPWVNEPC